MTERTFKLPDLGEGLHEAEIVEWHIAEGDNVEADQPLVSLETDKAVVEVPAPCSGRVAKRIGEVGDIVDVGAPLVIFDDLGVDEERVSDAGTVVGELPVSDRKLEEGITGDAGRKAPIVKAAPAIRALASRLGVDLQAVEPSGPGGAITRADVEMAASASSGAGAMQPLRGVRRAMAARMAAAHREVVPATVSDDVDVELWIEKGDVTVRIIRAIVAACSQEPALNGWYDAERGGRRLHDAVDLGIAIDTQDGLFVPVLRDVGRRGDADLREGLERMKGDIRARTIPPEELRGATITLSNFGMLAGRYAAPVVVPPQVAILSTGRITPMVVAHEGKPAIRRIMPISLTFDHRVVTGGEAARFLAAAMGDLSKPGRSRQKQGSSRDRM